jgi:hypothetical protein
MEKWASAIDTIKADPPHIYSTIGPLDYKLPMVRTKPDLHEDSLLTSIRYLLETEGEFALREP